MVELISHCKLKISILGVKLMLLNYLIFFFSFEIVPQVFKRTSKLLHSGTILQILLSLRFS